MAGIEQIPLRIPDKWDPVWFERFVREVLAKADARNAIPGLGITIEGTPDTPATISSNTDVDQLVDQNYIVAEPSPLLANARTLDGEGGVIEVNDSGPGGIVRITVAEHGITYSKFREGRACSVVGRPEDSVGEQTSIEATANDTVLRRVNDELSFGPVTFPMVQLSGESLLLGRGAGDGAGAMQEITLGTGLSLDGTTLNATGGGGGGGGALVYVNTSIPSGNTIANTASETAFDSSYTIPADTLEAGMIVRVRLFGVFSTTGTPTLQLRIKLGSTTYIDTGAITLPSSVTDMGFCVDAQLVVHSAGATGEIDAQGVAMLGLTTATAQAVTIPNTSTVTTDTTGSLALSATAEWSTADADNTVTLREMAVWLDGIVSPTPDSGGANVTPDTHPATPDAMDDEFEGASLDSKWAWRNQGTATATLSQGSLVMTAPANSALNLRGLEQTVSSPGRWRCKVASRAMADFNLAGLYLANNGTGRMLVIDQQNAGGTMYVVQKFSNATTFGSNVYGPSNDTARYGAIHQWVYLEVEYDGVTVYFRVSASGVDGTFRTLYSEAAATFLGTPDRVGLVVNSSSAVEPGIGVFDWFRRMA